uniref:pro-opiomelanocortin-like n=1 Tax=Doryrhamphus excisus TaxID=161450 RepID=UPI0025AE4A7D|nr:pro-opiomelanocortin-like [Doryrhamphus excisus]
MCPAWLLVCAVLVGVSRGTISRCWDQSECEESDETLRDPHDAQLQPPRLPDTSSSPVAKRSYSMEHFRWGKPVGRKRRPITAYISSGAKDSSEMFPAEMRRDLSKGADEEVTEEQLLDMAQKKDGSYKMKHFRWSVPLASKRYGGVTQSWDATKLRPLLVRLLNKDAQNTVE